MRVLWFSHFIPFPPRGGSFQRSYNLIRGIAQSADVSLIAFNMLAQEEPALVEFRRAFEQFCSSVEIWELPVRWRSPRWWMKLAANPLRSTPFTCSSFWSDQLRHKWIAALDQHPGAVVHFDSPDLALFSRDAASFRKILNHHNCESAMAFRRAQQESGWARRLYLRKEAEKLVEVERDVCPRFDVNVVVSQSDGELLRKNAPHAHVHVVENGTDTDYFAPDDTKQQNNTVIFTGSLDWYPNIAGLRRFVRESWPLVAKANPGIRLVIAGRKPIAEVRELAASDITIEADPIDIRPLMAQASVFVCPIYDGGGTRLKILDALAMGKAVVSTTIGCEGLDVTPGQNILIGDSASSMAENIGRAVRDRDLRLQLGRNGRILVENRYSWRSIVGHLRDAYSCAENGSCRTAHSSA